MHATLLEGLHACNLSDVRYPLFIKRVMCNYR